jgi:O-antigen/teichoic acid export membrane protein
MKSGITSNIIWKFGERITAQLVSFIVSLVLARLLLPDDYGAVAIVLVFINVANIFVSDGFGTALVQKKNADHLDFSSVFFANICLSILLYLIIFSSAPWISNYYGLPVLTPVLRVLGIRIIFAAINSVQQAYVSRQMQFRKFFFSTIIGTVVSGIAGLIVAYRGGGVWALVIQYLVNVIMDTSILWITVKWRPTYEFSFTRLKKLLSFGWKILFEALSNTIANQIRNLIIGKVYTSADLGYYTKAQQFPSLFMNNIGASISAVILPAMSKKQDDPDEVKQLMRKTIRISSYFLFPCFFGMFVVSDKLIVFLLGEKWAETSIYLRILCFTTLFTIGMYPRHQALKAIGRSDVYMYEHIISRIIGIAILFLVYRVSVLAIALSGVASTFILTATNMFTSKRFNRYSYTEQVIDIAPILGLCIIMCIPVYFVGMISASLWVSLFMQILVGAAVYCLFSFFIKPEGFRYLHKYVIAFFRAEDKVQ